HGRHGQPFEGIKSHAEKPYSPRSVRDLRRCHGRLCRSRGGGPATTPLAAAQAAAYSALLRHPASPPRGPLAMSLFSPILERFAQQAPFCVMARGLLEGVFAPGTIDALFDRHASAQYT